MLAAVLLKLQHLPFSLPFQPLLINTQRFTRDGLNSVVARLVLPTYDPFQEDRSLRRLALSFKRTKPTGDKRWELVRSLVSQSLGDGPFYFCFCTNTMVMTEHMRSCWACKRCSSVDSWHCEPCGKCVAGIEQSCRGCGGISAKSLEPWLQAEARNTPQYGPIFER